MLWLKAWHVVFVVTWFAGLLYLPRLFVYHAGCGEGPGYERLCLMERRLFAIMTVGGLLAAGFGAWLLFAYWLPLLAAAHWLQLKLLLVGVLIVYHGWCWTLLRRFARRRNRRSARWFRWFNEVPALILVAVVILAVVKPF